jgi:hypothetical protein
MVSRWVLTPLFALFGIAAMAAAMVSNVLVLS